MKLFFAFILSALSISAYAQNDVSFSDPDWGEKQHIAERAAYWHAIDISGPDTNIAEARIRGFNQFVSIPRPKGMMIQSVSSWEQVGGSQGGVVSGRPTAIAFDPVNSQTYYLGTSGGGLWKTTNNGNNWVNLSDSWTSYAMGGVAVDPKDRNTIYAATGDLYDRTGDGFYKSTDAGMNWVHLANASVIGSRCNQVLIDPQVPSTVYITGTDGIRRSLDGGVTWKKIVSFSGTTHMVIDPSNSQNLYAAGGGVIKKSTDGGNTWSTGDLASNIGGKFTITLGISKSDPSKIYASVGSTSGGSTGVARSDDYGATWTLVWSADNYMSQQAFYDNACAVSPTNSNIVLVGGLDIWGSIDGGSTLNQYTQWQTGTSASNFSHADVHVLAYGPLGLYALTDGGIFFSSNNGKGWQQSKNVNLSNMLFVGADAAPDFSYVLGGAQDNGINRATEKSMQFKQTAGGDGGRCFISQSDGTSAYSTYIGAVLHKSGDAGMSWENNLIPDGHPLTGENVPFYMNYDVSETDGSILAIAGGSHVYYSTSGGTNGIDQISTSSQITGSIVTVHVCAADGNIVYAGASGGYVYTTQNAGDIGSVTWTKSTTHIGVVSSFVTDPDNTAKVWAVISGYGSGAKHFWRSEDYGKTWTSPATNLPDLDATSIARAPNGDLFIGTTFGVLRSVNNGVTWETLRDGLPLCDVRTVRVRGTDHQWLLASTYGRGMYRINISELPRTISAGVTTSASESSELPQFTSISPNPIHATGIATINFKLPKESNVNLVLYNDRGIEAKTLLKEFNTEGEHQIHADLSDLSSGIYYAVLSANGHAITQRIVITK
jgi:hypothetical protein